MPWSYHKYVGHDINRDAFMLNMTENRTLARFLSREWHPQVFLAMHQMGSNGPRFFVPPNYDPIDPNQDPLIWREAALLGSAMALELESQGKSGVVSNAMYDYYWPGLRGLRAARPQHRVPADRGGLGETREPDRRGREGSARRNARPPAVRAADQLPQPLARRHLAPRRHRRLQPRGHARAAAGRLAIPGRAGVELRSDGPPVDRTRREGRPVRVRHPARPARPRRREQARQPAGGRRRRGAAGVGAVQGRRHRLSRRHGLRHHGAAVPGVREEPARGAELPGAEAGWIAPRRSARTTWPGGRCRYQMGVRVERIEARVRGAADVADRSRDDDARVAARVPEAGLLPGGCPRHGRGRCGQPPARRRTERRLDERDGDAGRRHATGRARSSCGRSATRSRTSSASRARLGLRVFGARGRMPASRPVVRARVGLYRPWNDAIDEGWTRWLLEQYEFPFKTLRDAEARAGNLRAAFDVIVLPAHRRRSGSSTATAPARCRTSTSAGSARPASPR